MSNKTFTHEPETTLILNGYTLVQKLALSSLVIIIQVILLIGALTACGKDEGNKKGAEETKLETKTSPHALSLKDKNSMPDCTDENEFQLVYITSEKQFYTCEAGEWVTINISVEQKNQIVEKKSAFDNILWKDEVTGKYWYIKGMGLSSMLCGSPTANTTAATADEVKEALNNGMFEGVNVRVRLNSDGSNDYVYSEFPSVEYTDNVQAFLVCLINE